MYSLLEIVLDYLVRKFFNFQPKIRCEGNRLVARTGWKTVVFSLGGWFRHVTVDSKARIVRIRTRRFWFFAKSRRLEYDWIQSITYSYTDMNPSTAFTWTGQAAYQADDLFVVGLLLKNGEEVPLFRFLGEGDWVNESIYPDWVLLPSKLMADVTSANLEDRSLRFVELLSGLIGVPLADPGF